jgi:hypothetical protein
LTLAMATLKTSRSPLQTLLCQRVNGQHHPCRQENILPSVPQSKMPPWQPSTLAMTTLKSPWQPLTLAMATLKTSRSPLQTLVCQRVNGQTTLARNEIFCPRIPAVLRLWTLDWTLGFWTLTKSYPIQLNPADPHLIKLQNAARQFTDHSILPSFHFSTLPITDHTSHFAPPCAKENPRPISHPL